VFLISSPAAAQDPQHIQQSIDMFMREMDVDNDGHITFTYSLFSLYRTKVPILTRRSTMLPGK
jgi:hypothetical protein